MNLQFCFLLFQRSSCSEDYEAFHHWSCEGVVSLISHVSFFPTSGIHRPAVVLCSLDQHFLQRNGNIALLKTQKAKTVASGFKVTELVNFLVCFAELNEKDVIECYCLGININNHKNPPVVIFFPLCKEIQIMV